MPTDEQIAKMRAKNPEIPVHVSVKIVWEPLEYRKFIGDDLIAEEVDYLRVTTGKGLSAGDEQANVQRVRDGGFPAIPADSRMKVPDPKRADPAKMEQEFKRFYVAGGKVGLILDVDEDGTKTGKPGQLFSPAVGKIYACTTPNDYPTVKDSTDGGFGGWDWDNTKTGFARIPVREVTDFVQPETIPERRYERREGSEDGGGAPGVTTTAAPAALDSESIKAAVALLGIEGKTVSVVNASAAALVASNIAKAPQVLGASSVNQAAMSGKFVDFLVSNGAVSVVDGKVVLVG